MMVRVFDPTSDRKLDAKFPITAHWFARIDGSP